MSGGSSNFLGIPFLGSGIFRLQRFAALTFCGSWASAMGIGCVWICCFTTSRTIGFTKKNDSGRWFIYSNHIYIYVKHLFGSNLIQYTYNAPIIVDHRGYIYNRRKFRSQTSDNMDRWKAEQGRGREKRKIRRKKSRRERVRRKKMQMREKVGKSRNTVFFLMIWGSGGSKSKLAKAADAEPSGQMRDEKLHAVVARSTFPSQNVQNTPRSDHFWKLRCRKSARRCGAKHISKSKRTKHTIVGPLLEVARSKKCTPLWREAHFEVKMYKTHHVRTTSGSWHVEKVHTVVARSTFPSQNVQNTRGSDHFWRFRCQKCTPLWREAHFQFKMLKTPGVPTTFGGSDVASLHYTTLHYTTLHSTTLHSTTRHYIPQHYNYNYTTTLHYTPLHSTTLNYTTLHYITLHYTPLHYTTLHYTTFHYTSLHYTTLTTLHYITLHYTEWHCTTE